MPAPPDVAKSDPAMYSADYIGPEQQADAPHDGAPAGKFPSDAELPIRSVHGGAPMVLGGYSATGEQPSLPAPGSTDGAGLPPSGDRK